MEFLETQKGSDEETGCFGWLCPLQCICANDSRVGYGLSFVCLDSAQGIHRQYICGISKYLTAL